MQHLRKAGIWVIAPLLLSSIACGQDTANQSPGMAYYQHYCAGCHGVNMDGGNGGSLKDDVWKFGSSREDIFKSIHDGMPDLGMPAYSDSLSDEQINLIVDAVMGVEKEQKAAPKPVRSYSAVTTLDYKVARDVWVEGLDIPWAIEFLDDETALITERPGPVRLVKNGKLDPRPIEGTPQVLHRGQGGMLEVVKDPEYAENGWIYLAYSNPHPNGSANESMTKLVRGRIQNHKWVDEEVIFEPPIDSYSSRGVHFGCRIVFDEEGFLYFPIGDRGQQELAQDLSRPNGKVFRINRDGSVPEDNPFVGRNDAMPEIYSYGHRNPQGLSFHPVTGELWDAEHGPRGGDELNIVEAGRNYGWPVITYGINYSGTVITRERVRPGMEQPVWYWRPSTGLCPIDFYTGSEFPYWHNHLLVGALRDQDVRLMKIQEGRVIHEEILLDGIGRVRDIETGPDGAIYVVLNDPNEVLRLTSLGEALQ